jgi:hypothetical protein
MTKRELMLALMSLPDNAEVMVYWTCDCGNHNVLEGIVDLNENGSAIQLNTESGRAHIDQAWQENLSQTAKVTASAEGRVTEEEWRAAQPKKKRGKK